MAQINNKRISIIMRRTNNNLKNRLGTYLHKRIASCRRALLLVISAVAPIFTYAQIGSNPTLDNVNSELKGLSRGLGNIANTVLNLVQLIAGILALVALVTLVAKFQEGDHEAKKKLMMWLGALIVLFAAISIVKALFNIGGVF